MEEKVNLVRKVIHLKTVVLFLGGFLNVPVAAQPKVVPGHLDEKPLRTTLLVPQRHHGVNLGGAAGGNIACQSGDN